MPVKEFQLWIAKANRDGLPLQRIEHVLAMGFAYLGRLHGGSMKATDFFPTEEKKQEPVLQGEAANNYLKAWVKKYKEHNGGESRNRNSGGDGRCEQTRVQCEDWYERGKAARRRDGSRDGKGDEGLEVWRNGRA
jgi:hypothetical protein